MIKILTDVVLTIAGFQLLLLAVVLLAQPSKNPFNRNLLVSFLLTKAFLMLRWFLFRFEILAYADCPYLYIVSKSAFFLLAPILYFYIRSLCYKDFHLSPSALGHLLPFVLIVAFNVASAWLSLREATDIWSTLFVGHHFQIFWTLNLIQILGYILAMLHTVHRYQKELKNHYSALEKINLRWLTGLLLLISLHWLFVTARATLVLLNVTGENLIRIIDLYSITIFLVFTTILVFKGMAQLKIFTGIEARDKYAGAKLPDAEMTRYLQQLTHYMSREKPYLIPSLTLEDLSEKLAIPTWQLSQVINQAFKQNFFNFINRYRIEEVKRQLKKSGSAKKTILEILYAAGFNSKSTFNDVFKKFTGMTPSQFKSINHN